MIVTCEECSTSFQLDESRIPAAGARVRCSRCKHAFFLANPSTSATSAVHDIAEQAATEAQSPLPAATEDLSESSLGSEAQPAAEPEPSIGDDLDEEDWQFSEEVRIEGDDDAEDDLGGELDDVSAFGDSSDFADGLSEAGFLEDSEDSDFADDGLGDEPGIAVEAETASELDSGLELDAPPAIAAPVRDESSFGSVEDFSALMDDEDPTSGEALGAAIESELETESAGMADAGSYSTKGATDDLGDPESWDLVASDDYAVARSGSGAGLGGRREALPEADESAFFDETPFDDSLYGDGESGRARWMRPLAALGQFAGWTVTLGLIAAVTYLGFQGEIGRWSDHPQRVEIGPFHVETSEVGWVETSRAGALLRFEGRVENRGSRVIWPGAIRLAMLDRAGEKLTFPPVEAGLPIPAEILREATPETLMGSAEQAIRRLAMRPLAPGEELVFEALIEADRMPEHAERFLLEVEQSNSLPPASVSSGPSREIASGTTSETRANGPPEAAVLSETRSASNAGLQDPPESVELP